MIKDLSGYLASVIQQPDYTRNAQIVATAIPSSVIAEYESNPTALISQLATATPDWFKNLPTSVQGYYNSIGSAEASIISKDVAQKGPAPTHGPVLKMVAGVGAVAAGVVVGAL